MLMHTRLLNELQIKVKTLNSYFVCSRAGCASNNKEPQKVFPTSAQPCYFGLFMLHCILTFIFGC